MSYPETEGQIEYLRTTAKPSEKKGFSALFSRGPLHVNHPPLIHIKSTPLFKLERTSEHYAHLLKKKDVEQVGPLVNYVISTSGPLVYLGGDAVKNLYFHGRKRYKTLTILAIMTSEDVEKYAWTMNNVISSNDGAFSLGMKYRVRKNRQDGCFKDIAQARYIIEPRLEGPEKLLYPLRSSTIELDLTTQMIFSSVCDGEAF